MTKSSWEKCWHPHKGLKNVWSFLHCQVGPDVATTWGRWWTAKTVPRTHWLLFSPTPSHSHFVPVWLITSAALSLLLFFPNIMWDEVKCYGKLSKIKTREQLSSQISCMTFIAQLLTQPCLCCPWRWVLMTDCSPWKEWECCIQRRWRCAVHYHSPSPGCFVLFSFLHLVHSSSSPFPYSCFVFVTSHPPCISLPLSFQLHIFSWTRHRSPVICSNLKVFSISPPLPNSAVICPATFLTSSTFSSFCQPLHMAPV